MNDTQNMDMEIIESEAQPVFQGSPDNFSGRVKVKSLFAAHQPSRVTGGAVTFEAGARTVWHTHPYGQALVVLEGIGRVRQWGGPLQEIRPGDVVWFPAGLKHWHGAAPDQPMSHVAVQEELEGQTVQWLEPVSDDQYNGR